MRARNIKPGFYKNEQLAECSPWARLIFPGLWMMADRRGRMEYRPKRIKAELLPFDSEPVEPMIAELEQYGLVRLYEVEGVRYLWIPAFCRHQRPHTNEVPSTIPPHPEDDEPGDDLPPRSTGLATKVESPVDQGDNHFALNPSSLNPEVKGSSPLVLLATLGELQGLVPAGGVDHAPPDAKDREESSAPLPGASPESVQAPVLASSPTRETDRKGSRSIPDCPYLELVAMYHEALPGHPRVLADNDRRRKQAKARWLDAAKRLHALGKPVTPESMREYFRRLFTWAGESAFLTGQVHSRDRPPFLADFDFFMQAKSFIGLIEGKYHRTAG